MACRLEVGVLGGWGEVLRDDKGGRGGVECGGAGRVGLILGGCAWWSRDEGMICNELM